MSKLLALTSFFLLAGCVATDQPQNHTQQEMVGMANPASVFCIEKGGELEIIDEELGQVGYCHFLDGKVIEEWKYFRENNPK